MLTNTPCPDYQGTGHVGYPPQGPGRRCMTCMGTGDPEEGENRLLQEEHDADLREHLEDMRRESRSLGLED